MNRPWFPKATVMLLVLFLAPPVLAAKKPPARLCFSPEAQEMGFFLVIKKAGATMKMQDGKMKLYMVHGVYQNGGGINAPVTGTGYMVGSRFHFNLSGRYGVSDPDPQLNTIRLEGFYDVDSGTGTVYVEDTALPLLPLLFDLDPISCKDFPLPSY